MRNKITMSVGCSFDWLHPSAVCSSLECKHTFDAPGHYRAALSPPVICGDRVFIVYEMEDTDNWLVSGTFIQVINWRKGYVNRHFLCQPGIYDHHCFYPVDEQKFVIIGLEGSIYLYTLQGLDGPPQCRIIYHPPMIPHLSLSESEIVVHGLPSLLGKAARPGLMPSYVPSLESQIMVLEFLSEAGDAILVIDMPIFSDMALHSDMLVEIPGQIGDLSMRATFHTTKATISACLAAKWPMLFPKIISPILVKDWKSSPMRVTSMCISGTSISESLLARKVSTILTHRIFAFASRVRSLTPLVKTSSRIVHTLQRSVIRHFRQLTAIYSWNRIGLL
ncbi:hypothetical protein BDR06DRAFT_498180 [Suillus hirtellus]|nr:hypothetical protein BDR06DRAFT_498180 [Suillus hirtellus]